MTSARGGSITASSRDAGTAARPRLILGSASPRRLELLAQIGIAPAEIRPADIDETPQRGESARSYVLRMATEKAAAIPLATDEAVLCADTTVSVGRRILGKPQDADEARAFLALMSGRRHRVLTAIAVRHAGTTRTRLVETVVRMRMIDAATTDRYIASNDWRGKAGGYAIQGPAAEFIPWIQGSFSAVVGLPLSETAAVLSAIGITGDLS